MVTDVEQIADDLLNLPPASRAWLAVKLITSLDEAEENEADELWAREAERRYREIVAGKVDYIPAEEALKKAREMLK